MGFVVAGVVVFVVAGVLFFIQRNQHNRANCVRMARAATVAELETMAKEIAQEIGGGSWREYVKVAGEIVCDRPLTAPLSEQPCAHYRMTVRREYEERVTVKDSEGKTREETQRSSETMSTNEQSVPFVLRDRTGTIEVDLESADVETITVVDEFRAEQPGGLISFGGFTLATGTPSMGRRTLGYHYHEVILPLHRQATIVASIVDQGNSLVLKKPTERDKHFIVALRTAEDITKAAQDQAILLRRIMIGCVGLGSVLTLVGLVNAVF
ncbi:MULTISPECIES: E3 ubiquitin ligase family protein [unclassified Leptolyngbya]|uniref:E3 ubiquitin ligase family protein n=1 Tax=unclassified Leptolyngbya TaxID=2650499 RepID=UPI001681EAD0|nr:MULTISPECIES: E3 ubiquitin ligase family protein [unclassified Leptolyngbya]MBD1912433.1 E3 ubiquitin ligase [Leptolyngbya sp. FACHB-8]MBD2157934.1 E3 ubiquitin ligase [Leptolyngbya sp. FACHB-16]